MTDHDWVVLISAVVLANIPLAAMTLPWTRWLARLGDYLRRFDQPKRRPPRGR